MSWTAPMTAVANATFTAAQFNQYIRDNLNMTFPALATTSGQIAVATGANAIAARFPNTSGVTTTQSTTSTSYTDLTTAGPSVTATTGTRAIVSIASEMNSDTDNATASATFAISGATTIAADDTRRICRDGMVANNVVRYGITHMVTSLTAGSNTFTMKYLAGSGTASFGNRTIVVIPL